MILGMPTATYTAIHVVISLIGIATGLVVLLGMLGNRWLLRWNAIFLLMTILTSVTGFGFPFSFDHLLPSHKVGFLSLILLAIALVALYGKHMAGGWRRLYVYTAMIAEGLNIFVLIVQAFLKVPALHALAPNGKEPPFAITQLIVLVTFGWLTIRAARRFQGPAVPSIR
jgi:hypothetical protein